MTKLEELAEKAKQAQRTYDRAKEATTQVEKLKEGNIIATSKADGNFEWKCKASTTQVVRHTAKTVESAITTLKSVGDDMGIILLSLAIMEEIKKLTVAESNQ